MRTSNPLRVLHHFMLFSIITILADCTPEFAGQTTDGRYKVNIKPVPDPIPLNALFSLNLMVEKTEGGTLPVGTGILVDATMPAHKHGMNTVPTVVPGNAPGRYLAQGLLFHMPGNWEITIRIQEGDSVSEAKFKVRI